MHFFFDWFQIVQAGLTVARLFPAKEGKEVNYHADVYIHDTLTP